MLEVGEMKLIHGAEHQCLGLIEVMILTEKLDKAQYGVILILLNEGIAFGNVQLNLILSVNLSFSHDLYHNLGVLLGDIVDRILMAFLDHDLVGRVLVLLQVLRNHLNQRLIKKGVHDLLFCQYTALHFHYFITH